MDKPHTTPAANWRTLIEAHRDLIQRDDADEDQQSKSANMVIPVFRRAKHRQRLLVTSIAE